jgi:hypothetical protein
MFPRKRKCGIYKIVSRDLTRIFEGLAFATYILVITMVLSLAMSILELPETLHWGIWLTLVVYGAPADLTRGKASRGFLRVLRNVLQMNL